MRHSLAHAAVTISRRDIHIRNRHNAYNYNIITSCMFPPRYTVSSRYSFTRRDVHMSAAFLATQQLSIAAIRVCRYSSVLRCNRSVADIVNRMSSRCPAFHDSISPLQRTAACCCLLSSTVVVPMMFTVECCRIFATISVRCSCMRCCKCYVHVVFTTGI